MACKFAEQAQEAFKVNTGWTHQVLDVHPYACQERAQHIVADCQHKGEVLIWCDESAQHQRLHRHQAVQAREPLRMQILHAHCSVALQTEPHTVSDHLAVRVPS